QLDLLKLAAGSAAQLRARATTVMRRDAGNTRSPGVWLEELPHYLLGHSLPLDLVRSVHWPQDVAFRHSSLLRPNVDGYLHPGRHGNGADAAVLPDEIHDAPAVVPLLDVLERKRSHFGAP